MKKTLAILLIAAVALSAFTVLQSLTVKADTSDVQIVSYSWYFAPDNPSLAQFAGDIVVVGEIKNVGTSVIDYAAIKANAYNGTTPIDTGVERALVHNILPGQKSPFYIDMTPMDLVNPDPSIFPSVNTVQVSVADVAYTTQTQYADISVVQPSGSLSTSGSYTVTGSVTNTGSKTANNVFVLATFYSANDTAVAVNYAYFIAKSLAPGMSAPFSTTPADDSSQLSSQISKFSLQVQTTTLSGDSTPTAPPTQPPSTPTPAGATPTPVPTAGSSSSPGAPASLPLMDIVYIAVIVVAAIVIVIVALMIVKMRKNAAA